MNFSNFIKTKGYTILLGLAIVSLLLSILGNIGSANTDMVAKVIEKRVEKRIEKLETYVAVAVEANINEPLIFNDLPKDMVIYRYVNDSLESWNNQFNIFNDDISCKFLFNRLTGSHNQICSPIHEVEEHYTYLNLGPKWYIIKKISLDYATHIIAGLEIKNDLIENPNKAENGVNNALKLSARYTVHPINDTGGTVVTLNDYPLFRIIFDGSQAKIIQTNSALKWLTLLFVALTAIVFLYGHRSFKAYFSVIVILVLIFTVAYQWGKQVQNVNSFFSPAIYADGDFLKSFGDLILINALVVGLVISTCFMHLPILNFVNKQNKYKRPLQWVVFLLASAAIIGTIVIMHLGFKSLVLNSNINFDIFYWNDKSKYGIISYISYATLFITLPYQLVSLKPFFQDLFNLKFKLNGIRFSLIVALVGTIYFGVSSTYWGFKKEEDKAEIWANRLALNRDLYVEIQLKTIEDAIANDSYIFLLLSSDSGVELVESRISEYYISRSMSNYNVGVKIIKEEDTKGIAIFNQLVQFGNRITPNSRFTYFEDRSGQVSYSGLFIYYHPEKGVIRMIIDLKSKSGREERGYYSVLGQYSKTSDISIPSFYSYAKYKGEKLTTFKGSYAYPTLISTDLQTYLRTTATNHFKINDHYHFIETIGQDEIIIISRRSETFLGLFAYYSFIFLILWGLIYFFIVPKQKEVLFETNYYRARINSIIILSSFVILGSITAVSISYVVQRNELNMSRLMSNHINTLVAHFETKVRYLQSTSELLTNDFANGFEEVANITKADITLYKPCGTVLLSTTPEVFEKMVVGNRVDGQAYHNIVNLNKHFYIHKENLNGYKFYSIYAPVFNGEGDMIAILSSPFPYINTFFSAETAIHTALIFNLFIILLVASVFFSTHVVDAIFKPLANMAKKMSTADLSNLEQIEYNRKDEISAIVDKYNKMVTVFSDSTKQLAQDERDKAWSEMARQVAHEIKNPLTPIKLKIQQLIRLKDNNNPDWTERFDDVSKVVLEHIDILSNTANEFSTFAQLYSEDPSVIDLNEILSEQLVIFDNKDNMEIVYMGMEKAIVLAPKPQLIRVFVNLLTNATQAIENAQREAKEEGREVEKGQIVVCLRNSIKEGYYDIVFDDNGPGVDEDNQEKLFTPNFSTKSGGSGLGLAICRSIVEKCNGEISYKHSFGLKGASFTVTLPKYQD